MLPFPLDAAPANNVASPLGGDEIRERTSGKLCRCGAFKIKLAERAVVRALQLAEGKP